MATYFVEIIGNTLRKKDVVVKSMVLKTETIGQAMDEANDFAKFLVKDISHLLDIKIVVRKSK